MNLTFKYRLKDSSARKMLRQHAFAVNQVWNFAAETQRKTERLRQHGSSTAPWLSNYDLQRLTAGSSKELGLHAGSIGEICRYFAIARAKKRGAPAFRASGGSRRALGWIPFREKDRQIGGNAIVYLGKHYRFFGSKRRPLPETVKGGAFVEDAQGRWHVCFHVEIEANRKTGAGEVGIDLGLKTLATFSTGEKIDNLQHYRRYQDALGRAQRAGKKKRARSIHVKIANARRDQHHKATAKIARDNKLIVIGDVNAGRLVKTRMAKSVVDAAWTQFRVMLEYKAKLHRADFQIVDERWTSQTCSCCGTIPDSSPKGIGALGIREWACGECGAVHDRDANAARNILGRSAAPRGDGSRKDDRIGTTKQGTGEQP